MKTKELSRKIVCSALVIAMLSTNAVYAGDVVEKNESVYVTLSQNGTPREIIVSDWLHSNEPGKEIHDRSNLEDIQNVKGYEEPQKNGEELVWKIDGTDLFYRGKTSKKLPLDVKITYYLDDIEINPDELGGKSGKVRINIKLINTESHDVNIKGKTVKMYTPLTAAVTLDLPMDTFKNVEISEGKMFSDGDNQLITFAALPGLKDSLNLDAYDIKELEDLEFPEEIDITADAENFKMGPIMIAATPELPDTEKLKKSEEIDDIRQNLNDLDEVQKDADKLDPDKEKRSLVTNPDRVTAARLMTKDAFDFYDMDKALFDIAPDYVTKENIALYDRVKRDMKDADVEHLMDDPVFRRSVDMLSDSNITKIRNMIKDAKEMKNFRSSSIDKIEKFADYTKKNHKDAEALEDGIISLVNWCLNNEKALESLDKLMSRMESPEGQRAVDNLLSQVNSLGMGDMTIPNIKDPSLQADIIGAMNDIMDKILIAKKQELMASLDGNRAEVTGIAEKVVNVHGTLVSLASTLETILTVTPIPMDKAIQIAAGINGILAQMPEPKPQGFTITDGVLSDSEEEIKTKADVIKKTYNTYLSQENMLLALLKEPGSTIPPEAQAGIKAMIEGALYASKNSIASGITPTLFGITNSMMQGLSMNEITSSMNFARGLYSSSKPMLEVMKKPDAVSAIIPLFYDIFYLKEWGPKLISMQKDIVDNEENIQLILDMTDRYYEDPKIKHLVERVKDLQKDLDDTRPILKSLSDRMNDPRLDKCLHDSPQLTEQLLKMKKDLEDNKKIMEILRDVLQENNVALANKIIDKLDTLKGKDSIKDNLKKLDDIDELFNKKEALVKLSDEYGIFTDAGDNMDKKLKFIMKTDEIKIPEKAVNEVQPEKEKGGFLAWLKGIWGKITGKVK